ncbi:uncharacterized protein Z520_04807 [Fonsecaea multimorphosa CBS 102226]|uniref:Heterokaryon incompatibility domain-containing protein n=1 Tax=Fonsecaea multimorphosa CBS 102226 TaxID=1442371 RepID=A0A0D2IQH9_9EURO|nr:uncharacterized protein Z520_04807 [Fonsecaea multimorphosa CBS 102226]KIX99231.1 hypothetical protein Z520_04807 [Fonsecaea multimorphosa CBS 102226]
MDPAILRLLNVLSRQVRGKTGATPKEYFELCRCHPEDLSRPTEGISAKDLLVTASQRCLMCQVVQRGLETALGTAIDEEYNIKYKLKEKFGLKIHYMLKGDWNTRKTYQVYAAQDTVRLSDISEEIPSGHDIHIHPLESACIARIKATLEQCRENHPHCRSDLISALPTRVLYVGDQKKPPYLLCTKDEAAGYVALSHCWGSAQTLTTTTATLEERQNGIDWQALPKTFQDAIRVTRELGFDYIWIDSLCILQDSLQDWEKEAAKMGSIYEQAVLTIAASVADTDEAGFLQNRSEHLSTSYTIHHPKLENGTGEFRVREHLPWHRRHDIASNIRDAWRSTILGPAAPMEPLDHRAWTFQERLVSRRLLSFCGKEYEWDCLRGTNCECGGRRRDFNLEGWDARNGSTRQVYQSLLQEHLGGPDAFLKGRDSKELSMELVMRFNALKSGNAMPCGRCPDCTKPRKLTADEKRERAYTLWRTHLIPAYSQLKLTKEMDRLPALQAVARGLHSLCGEYIAGMWKADLPVAMAWTSGAYGSNGPQPGRPVDDRAPSWSWASIEGAVDHCINFEDEFKAVCDLGVVSWPENCDGFSNVDFAIAGLRGYLLPATLDVRKLAATGEEDLAQNSSFEYTCTIAEQRFTMYPDSVLERVEGAVERSTTGKQEEFSCPVTVLASVVIRVKSSNILEDDDGDDDLLNMASERRLVFLVLNRYNDSESRMLPYKRIGILPYVSSRLLPEEWFEHWQPSIFVLA